MRRRVRADGVARCSAARAAALDVGYFFPIESIAATLLVHTETFIGLKTCDELEPF
jgi:hypothetical protein